mgnify:CR=1 FL=1
MQNLVAKIARGNRYLEVGGLWGTVNETISTASLNGAVSLTMVDVYPPENDLWNKFRNRLSEFGIKNCECYSKDFLSPEIDMIFDVICCVGVFYHLPHPLMLLEKLKKCALKYVIFGSSVTEEVISNSKGRLDVPAGGVLFIPGLSDRERAILKEHWKGLVIGLTVPGDYEISDNGGKNFEPWWFLPTPSALRSMIEIAGFKIILEEVVPGKARNYLLQNKDYQPKKHKIF